MARLRRFLMNQEGVTAIEYALMAALIAMAIVGGVTLLGTSVSARYDNIATEVKKAY